MLLMYGCAAVIVIAAEALALGIIVTLMELAFRYRSGAYT